MNRNKLLITIENNIIYFKTVANEQMYKFLHIHMSKFVELMYFELPIDEC